MFLQHLRGTDDDCFLLFINSEDVVSGSIPHKAPMIGIGGS